MKVFLIIMTMCLASTLPLVLSASLPEPDEKEDKSVKVNKSNLLEKNIKSTIFVPPLESVYKRKKFDLDPRYPKPSDLGMSPTKIFCLVIKTLHKVLEIIIEDVCESKKKFKNRQHLLLASDSNPSPESQ